MKLSDYPARRDLGNIALVQANTSAARTWTLWEQLVQNVRYATHTMAANKTFTVLAILSLALGIGANTAIFSFMDSILSVAVATLVAAVILAGYLPARNASRIDPATALRHE